MRVILISCRAGFADPMHFGPHLARDGAKDLDGYPVPVGAILIHGFNTDLGAAEEAYGVIEKAADRECTGYLWPGGRWAIDYMQAVGRARECGWFFRDLLATLPPLAIVKPSVQMHSLANRVGSEALKHGGVDVDAFIMCAPAVDDDCFEPGKEFFNVPAHCKTVNVFCSSGDDVLKNDYPKGSFGRQALGLYGPRSIYPWPPNLRVFDCSRFIHQHSAYRFAPEYYAAWRTIDDGSAKFGLTVL